jgi:hypothetical protein
MRRIEVGTPKRDCTGIGTSHISEQWLQKGEGTYYL